MEKDIFIAELKDAAWNVLHENPGCGYKEWIQTLMEQYPAEVVDALGPDPEKALRALSELWKDGNYIDDVTGEIHKFEEWAKYFETEHSIKLYDILTDSKREIKALRRTLELQMNNPST